MIEIIKSKWQEILDFLKEQYISSLVSYQTFIEPLTPVRIEKNGEGETLLHILIKMEVDDKYLKTGIPMDIAGVIEKRFSFYISLAIEEITGIKCTPLFSIRDETAKNEKEPAVLINRHKKQVDQKTIVNANLNPRYKFDTFVVGKSNNFAHAASLAVAESPGEVYNPLFIYGGVGLGKTHLMHSIAHFILEQSPETKILYVTSETFTNELIDSIRNKNNYSTTEFRSKYRNIDVLLIDDIQFIIGKESTQEEFFHTFNTLYEAKKQIIISADKPPKDFETLEERLLSRFEWGLTVDIQSPDYETRMAILHKKEELDGINIDNEVIQYIATNIKSNIRELEGALTKIVAMGKLGNREIDLKLAQEVLKYLINPDTPMKITNEFIIKIVSDHFVVSREDLVSKKRNKEIVYPRHIAMYLCREMTDSSLTYIGECFGGRDHATVISAVNNISSEIKNNPDLDSTIETIKKRISPQ